MLFNQLVEAGVEAGGETAKALVEGGSETVNEINSLFTELDALGMELGENTAQVMYGQGENFVDGIVEGLTAQAGELEISAKSIAEAFTVAFEEVLIRGINQAIDAAEAALARMPQIGDYAPSFTPSTVNDGNDGNNDGVERAPISVPSVPVPLLPRDQQSLLQRGLEGTIFSTGEPPGQTRSVYSPQRNLQTSLNRSTGSIVNIYTSSSTRETQNAITRANSKSGAPVTTSVRAIADRRVG
jgi:hypothetical protein